MAKRERPELDAILPTVLAGIGYRARARRHALGLSQEEVADEMWGTAPVVSRLERGVGNVRFNTLYRFAQALGVEVADLIPPIPRKPSGRAAALEPLRLPRVGFSEAPDDPATMSYIGARVSNEPPHEDVDFAAEEVMREFGRRVREIRNTYKWSQIHFAHVAELQVTDVSKVELGNGNWSVRRLVHVAMVLDVELAPLLRQGRPLAIGLPGRVAANRVGPRGVGQGVPFAGTPKLPLVGVYEPPPEPQTWGKKSGRRRRSQARRER